MAGMSRFWRDFFGVTIVSRFWRENRFLLFQINEIDLFWDDGLGQPTRGVARNMNLRGDTAFGIPFNRGFSPIVVAQFNAPN